MLFICPQEGDDAIHENLKPEECDQLTSNAQMILVMLQFGAYREVLGCEGATPASELLTPLGYHNLQ